MCLSMCSADEQAAVIVGAAGKRFAPSRIAEGFNAVFASEALDALGRQRGKRALENLVGVAASAAVDGFKSVKQQQQFFDLFKGKAVVY